MNLKFFNDALTKTLLCCLTLKFIHYSTDKNTEHTRMDEFMTTIQEKADKLAECVYGYYGKPEHSSFSLEQGITPNRNPVHMLDIIHDQLVVLREQIIKDKNTDGIISVIDDFMSDINQFKYLCTFDRITVYR